MRRRAILRSHAIDVANPSRVAQICAWDVRPETDDVICRGDIQASLKAQGSVVVAGNVVRERKKTVGRVGVAASVGYKCAGADGRVLQAGGVKIQCLKPVGRVDSTGSVVKKRIGACGRV